MPYVIMKFGGTSVATADGWRTVQKRIALSLRDGETPIVVHSALAGVSNKLEEILRAAPRDGHAPVVEAIRAQHVALGNDLGIDGATLISAELALLDKLTAGIALIGEVSPKQHARVVALGELMASRLGFAFLHGQGVNIAAVDARRVMRSVPRRDEIAVDHYLNADCLFAPDADTCASFTGADAFLTQGFIATDAQGDTVLLGRGGSDTSASSLASIVSARRIEIWTDVAGMYSADPRLVPGARILKKLDYAEAQEIASTGAKVLHPKCLRPARRYNIPLRVLSTAEPDAPGTLVSGEPGSTDARLKAVSARKGITLVSMETSGMWQEPGFLARAFAIFARRQLSIDLISSSETSVTVSLDAAPAKLASGPLQELVEELSTFCRVNVAHQCAAISLVGRQVRAILHELAPAFDVFKEFDIYLVSQAANDLNFTFVVDEEHSDKLVQRLHDLLIRRSTDDDPVMGRSWAQSHVPSLTSGASAWWLERRDELLTLAPDDAPLWVYERATLTQAAQSLLQLANVDRLFFSIKANSNVQLLQHLADQGVHFECVSAYELRHLFASVPKLDPANVLFTPNFAPRAEYEFALQRRVQVTIDNPHVLQHWPELFAGRDLLMRVDPGQGKGHHRYVLTAGKNSKFGIPLHAAAETAALAAQCGAKIIGLHAHKGSGIVDAATWAKTARTLAQAATALGEDVRVLNLGGGLGVPDTRADAHLDVVALDRHLHDARKQYPKFDLWLEPGRYLCAQAGVLLTRVTQCKDKDGVRYVGVNTGMNSLIRPALYGAHHEIVNLSRWSERATELVDVVGPICESADVIGSARMLPPCREGDVLLIANAGAYGRVMSSHYNLRPPGEEIVI